MHSKIKRTLKTSPKLLKMINGIGNILFSILKYLIIIKKQQILFVSFGGQKYDDSPKSVYEMMIQDVRFKNFEFIWAFTDKSLESNVKKDKRTKFVKIDTPRYFKYVLSSKVWITNTSVERSFNLKRKKIIYMNTWHGTPLKKMGFDIQYAKSNKHIARNMLADIFLAQSDYEAEIFSRIYGIPMSNMVKVGLPRNDKLGTMRNQEKKNIKEKLLITSNKKIILYAPTYRDSAITHEDENIKNSLVNWIEYLKNDYVVLVRAHYEVNQAIDNLNQKIIDVSQYPSLNDLMEISDILLTDYSSIMFDYSILKKPIYLYCYDFERYNNERGLYFDPRKYFPNTAEKENIGTMISEKYDTSELLKFKNKYVMYQGQATQKSIDKLWSILTKDEHL